MSNELIKAEMDVNSNKVGVMRIGNINYISLTDLAKFSNPENPANVIIHWMSNRGTFEFIGLWENLNNPDFNFTGFSEIENKEVGYPSFTMSPKRWIQSVNAIGIVSKGGRYSIGTFAHPDIAFEFASWLSPEFKLYLIKEFERLKQNEAYQNKVDWSESRILSKVNYRIHTDAIKNTIVPNLISEKQKNLVYPNEADLLNVALFGMTAKEWKEKNPELKGNQRDYANIRQLLVLSNLENINAVMITDKLSQSERLIKLNNIAINQMKILENDKNLDYIERKIPTKLKLIEVKKDE